MTYLQDYTQNGRQKLFLKNQPFIPQDNEISYIGDEFLVLNSDSTFNNSLQYVTVIQDRDSEVAKVMYKYTETINNKVLNTQGMVCQITD